MDPARSENRASEALSDAERDARIEQLLLTGLDFYFASEYDQAINLWTRVLFLDRHHDRARAYIERARSAMAERQRESEALLHEGLDAFRKGDMERARQLLDDALAQGASRDSALGVLARIERLEVAQPDVKRPRRRSAWSLPRPAEPEPSPAARGRSGWTGAILLGLAAIGALAVGVWGVALPDLSSAQPRRESVQATPTAAEPLPLPAANEVFLSRARRLFATGRLRDAIREIDRVPIGDSLRPEADRLRADIQRALLAVAAGDSQPAATSSPPDE